MKRKKHTLLWHNKHPTTDVVIMGELVDDVSVISPGHTEKIDYYLKKDKQLYIVSYEGNYFRLMDEDPRLITAARLLRMARQKEREAKKEPIFKKPDEEVIFEDFDDPDDD